MSPLKRTLLLGCIALALPGVAAANAPQQGEGQIDSPGSVAAERLLDERDRENAHPGDPMKIVGLFQGGNDLTRGKGALSRSTYEPKMIDSDEAYERQLAMYEKGSNYNYAYAPAFNGEEMPVMEPVVRRPVAPEAPPGSSTDAWIAALSVAALASLALMYQGRK